ncbi:MAG: PASTA domain-containing protein [Solirubrobacteraceae bacterium]
MLNDAGFGATETEQPSTTVTNGDVISTNPQAGSQAQPGSTVAMVVSSGPQVVPVPDVSGMTQSAAQNTLENAGFPTTTELQSSTSVPSGDVIGTQPPAQTEWEQGQTVTVLVSSG